MSTTPPWDYLPLFMRRPVRRLWRRLGRRCPEVVYHDKYNAAFPDVPNDPLRAERILAFLAAEGLVLDCCVHRPEPVWLKTLELVHDPGYLDAVHSVEALTSIMGSEVTPGQVDRMIDLQRLQTGGTLMATRRARDYGVAVNLGGGFHHAMADRGGGFCIFNDVAVAIADERRRGFTGRVLVVDLDLHDGDGTRQIFAADPDVYTFSIHASHWGPTEAVASTSVALGGKVEDATYLAAIEEHLPPVVRDFAPRLVFYVAGCDPAADDLMGDWRISAEAMYARDRRVYELVRGGASRPPLVVVLAGGYSQQCWRYTARFLSSLGRGVPVEPPSTEEITLKRYRYISSLFDVAELSGASRDNEFGLSEEDLLLPGWGTARETRFLGFYTRTGIEMVLERAGFLDRLRDLGYSHPTLELALDEPNGQTLRLYGSPRQEELLVELQVRRDRRALPGFELLFIEWLLMQNPRAAFGRGRPRLPGQEHPGLGMLNDVIALLSVACERLHLDGLAFVPSQFHVAAYGRHRLTFFDPESRARYDALQELFCATPLAEATRAIADGKVVDADTGEPFRWQPAPMLMPVSEKLKEAMEKKDEGGRKCRYRLLDGERAAPRRASERGDREEISPE